MSKTLRSESAAHIALVGSYKPTYRPVKPWAYPVYAVRREAAYNSLWLFVVLVAINVVLWTT